ncbi:hypothetical protein GUJ93_ZPchr0007g3983 [Zizania palustris]|uniref:Alpha/beta hydrolase fold-3 domain-containing protein n=1 Tax=Zizania palustris TaxID=103762 RepID=A0A8J5SQP9_ZIZPA|nr:hypothetical protein GUJ93_ZPchr0007g3983 [Zizania palustris]
MMHTGKNAVVGDVAIDLHPFIRKYNDGRIERILRSSFVPPSEDPIGGARGVATKDVVIDERNGVSARLFLPSGAATDAHRRLPIVVYFHGGAFCTESAFCRTYHRYATSLASRAGALVVSVEYRLAPEHPVPAAHDDAWAALRWVASLPDPWLANYACPDRMFIAGDSAGGHIAYRTAVRASRESDGGGIDIEGLIIIQPYFWGPHMLPSEMAWDNDSESSVIDPDKLANFWPFVTSGQAGNDDPLIDTSSDEVASQTCQRALVAVAEKDFLRYRGLHLAALMRGCVWAGAGGHNVTLVESEGEDHGFHLYSPLRATSRNLMESVVQFINQSAASPRPRPWPASVVPELHGEYSASRTRNVLLSVPSRPYHAVFLNGLDMKARPRRCPRPTAITNAFTPSLDKKVSKKSFGLFLARAKPNNLTASKGPLSASVKCCTI